ncbi:MAG: DMT family transporter [Planctomycetaceae bacterium]
MSDPEPVEENPRAWTADLALFSVAVMWGINVPVIKRGVELIDRLAFNSLRLTLSAAILGLLVLMERQSKPVENRPWMKILLVAVITGFVYQLTFVLGVPRTLAGNTALILSATPMWTALIAWLIGMDRLPPIAWAGLIVTCAGAGLIAFSPSTTNLGSEYLMGNLLILGASLLWAVGSILTKPLFEYITPTRLAFLSAVVTLPAHYAVAGSTTLDAIQVIRTNPLAFWLVAYSGLFSTGFAYALWNYGVGKVGPSHASIYQNLVPIVALTSGLFIVDEIPGGVQIPGGILILGGLILMRRGRRGSHQLSRLKPNES